MADYFEHVCIVIPLDSEDPAYDAKRLWWDNARHTCDGDLAHVTEDSARAKFLETLELPAGTEDTTICSIHIEDAYVGIEDAGGVMHLDGICAILQAYLKALDPAGCFVFQWAGTCSHGRADAYCGGAVIVHATGWQARGTWDLLEELERDYLGGGLCRNKRG